MAVRHKKIAVVTGGSSGIGRYTAAALRDKGYLVYEFSRRHIPISGVNHLSVDVTDEEMPSLTVPVSAYPVLLNLQRQSRPNHSLM